MEAAEIDLSKTQEEVRDLTARNEELRKELEELRKVRPRFGPPEVKAEVKSTPDVLTREHKMAIYNANKHNIHLAMDKYSATNDILQEMALQASILEAEVIPIPCRATLQERRVRFPRPLDAKSEDRFDAKLKQAQDNHDALNTGIKSLVKLVSKLIDKNTMELQRTTEFCMFPMHHVDYDRCATEAREMGRYGLGRDYKAATRGKHEATRLKKLEESIARAHEEEAEVAEEAGEEEWEEEEEKA